jgi:hypothetical protein
VAARQRRAAKREEALEQAKMTLLQRLRVKAAERNEQLVSALIRAAEGGDMQAQRIVWDRLEGKVIDRLEVGQPEYGAEDLLKALAALPEVEEPVLPLDTE